MFASLRKKLADYGGGGRKHAKLQPKNCTTSLHAQRLMTYGLPRQSVCIARDAFNGVFAVGTRTGQIKIFGGDGRALEFAHPKNVHILQIVFLPHTLELATLTAASEIFIFKWDYAEPVLVNSLHFKHEKLTQLFSPADDSTWLFCGSEKGNVYCVEVATLSVSTYRIMWNHVTTGGFHPGAVVDLMTHPTDFSKLMVLYETGYLALWDLFEKKAIRKYHSKTQFSKMTSICWIGDGEHFVCGHADGHTSTWALEQANEPLEEDDHIDGNMSASKIYHVIANGNALVIHNGGPSPLDNGDRSVVVSGESIFKTIISPTPVIDFIPIASSPWPDADTSHVVLLLEKGIQVISLAQAGARPSLLPAILPHALELHTALTTTVFVTNRETHLCAKAFIARLGPQNIPSTELAYLGRGDNGKERQGGLRADAADPLLSVLGDNIVVTGHADGCVQFWGFAAGGGLKLLYVLTLPCVGNTPEHENAAVVSISVSPDFSSLMTCHADGTVLLYTLSQERSETPITPKVHQSLVLRPDRAPGTAEEGHATTQTKTPETTQTTQTTQTGNQPPTRNGPSPPPPYSAESAVSEEALAQAVALGFSRNQIFAELARTKGDLNMAISNLMLRADDDGAGKDDDEEDTTPLRTVKHIEGVDASATEVDVRSQDALDFGDSLDDAMPASYIPPAGYALETIHRCCAVSQGEPSHIEGVLCVSIDWSARCLMCGNEAGVFIVWFDKALNVIESEAYSNEEFVAAQPRQSAKKGGKGTRGAKAAEEPLSPSPSAIFFDAKLSAIFVGFSDGAIYFIALGKKGRPEHFKTVRGNEVIIDIQRFIPAGDMLCIDGVDGVDGANDDDDDEEVEEGAQLPRTQQTAATRTDTDLTSGQVQPNTNARKEEDVGNSEQKGVATDERDACAETSKDICQPHTLVGPADGSTASLASSQSNSVEEPELPEISFEHLMLALNTCKSFDSLDTLAKHIRANRESIPEDELVVLRKVWKDRKAVLELRQQQLVALASESSNARRTLAPTNKTPTGTSTGRATESDTRAEPGDGSKKEQRKASRSKPSRPPLPTAHSSSSMASSATSSRLSSRASSTAQLASSSNNNNRHQEAVEPHPLVISTHGAIYTTAASPPFTTASASKWELTQAALYDTDHPVSVSQGFFEGVESLFVLDATSLLTVFTADVSRILATCQLYLTRSAAFLNLAHVISRGLPCGDGTTAPSSVAAAATFVLCPTRTFSFQLRKLVSLDQDGDGEHADSPQKQQEGEAGETLPHSGLVDAQRHERNIARALSAGKKKGSGSILSFFKASSSKTKKARAQPTPTTSTTATSTASNTSTSGTSGPALTKGTTLEERRELLGKCVDARDETSFATRTAHASEEMGGFSHLREQAKLREEKLRRAEERAQELAMDAENFQSKATELADYYKNKKWWQW